MLTSNGAAHQRLRTMIAPAFGRAALDGYAPKIVAQTRSVQDGWSVASAALADDLCRELALGVAVKWFYGFDVLGDAAELGRLVTQFVSTLTTCLASPTAAACVSVRNSHGGFAGSSTTNEREPMHRRMRSACCSCTRRRRCGPRPRRGARARGRAVHRGQRDHGDDAPVGAVPARSVPAHVGGCGRAERPCTRRSRSDPGGSPALDRLDRVLRESMRVQIAEVA